MESLQAIQSLPQRVKKIEFKKELFKYLRMWYWFVLSLLFFIACAKVYLRYTTPQFLSKASVYLNGSIRKSSGFVGLNDLQNMGTGPSKNTMGDEIALMKSKPILLQVVKNLNLDTKVFVEGKVKKVEFYDDSPIQAKILKINNPDFGGETYEISPKDDFSFYLKKRENGSKKSYFFNIPINLGFGEVILNKKNNLIFDSSYNISFLNAKNIANQIEGSISIFSKEDSNILELNRTGEIPKMSEDILDELIKVYNDDAVKDKKFEASNSAEFIKDRLKIITAELANIEGKKTSYKKANNIFDIENQAQVSISGLDQGTQKSLELNAQLELVNSVLAMVNAKNEQLLPTNLGIPNAADGLMNQYNELILLRNKTLRQATPANPVIIQFNKEISLLKNLIKDNLLKSKDLLSKNLSYQQSKISQYKNEMTMFPEQENFFKNIDRQQKIKEALYLYLLQKNEEINMALAVTAPKVKVMNPAFTTGKVFPNDGKIMMYAYGLGFLIPLFLIFLKNALNTYIYSKADILDFTKEISVVAEIPTIEKGNADIIGKNDLSSFAESFRILNSNIKYFFNKDEKCPVILITSSIKGEGKTTVSVKTALTLALTKNVLIIGADIRNPQLKRFMKLHGQGLSEFLSDYNAKPQDFIQETSINKNLKLIHSGAIAPNPK